MNLPEPYYRDSQATIYCGDCRDILPGLPKVDLVLTDPPYVLASGDPGEAHISALGKFKGDAFKSLTNGFDVPSVMGALVGRLNIPNLFVFCSNKQLSSIMRWGEDLGFYVTALVWHKPNSTPFANGVWRGDIEFCVHIRGKGAYFQGGAKLKAKVKTYVSPAGTEHPTVKPLPLVCEYVQIGSDEGQTILDPFMGSGTTLVAAKQLGRKAIGIELEQKYCDIAVDRLRQGVLAL